MMTVETKVAMKDNLMVLQSVQLKVVVLEPQSA